MKLDEREIADLHELALFEAQQQGGWLAHGIVNGAYRLHVLFLVRMIQWLQRVNR